MNNPLTHQSDNLRYASAYKDDCENHVGQRAQVGMYLRLTRKGKRKGTPSLRKRLRQTDNGLEETVANETRARNVNKGDQGQEKRKKKSPEGGSERLHDNVFMNWGGRTAHGLQGCAMFMHHGSIWGGWEAMTSIDFSFSFFFLSPPCFAYPYPRVPENDTQ